MRPPAVFSHVGLTIPDLDRAISFYRGVFGCYLIMGPTEIAEGDEHDSSAISAMCRDVFGQGWGRFRIAHLSFGDRVGLELFEFAPPVLADDNFRYRVTGLHHFCIQDPDIEGALARIEAHGGRRRMPMPRAYFPGEKPYRMVYAEDPFGNVLEIYTHSYELTYGAGAYEAGSAHQQG